MFFSWLINLVILLLIAWVIGREREKSEKVLGFRSLAILMLGAYSFTSASIGINGIIDYHVIAQIVTGISFVGAGLILKDNTVHNLTTAILVWTMASLGVLIGIGKIFEAIILTVVIWFILIYKNKKKKNENG